MTMLRSSLALFTMCGLICTPVDADVKLPSIFSDHAVLQKTARVPIWGTAEPGEKVSIALGNAKASAAAGDDGKWKTTLDLSQSGPGPFELIVEGKNKLVASDVIVGEVWVCSGQSNMEWNIGGLAEAKAEALQSANPRLRQFLVSTVASNTPPFDATGAWLVASPETTRKFTAVGYYFGKKLEQELQTPVGLILAAWGGSTIESWIPKEALKTDPDLAAGTEKINNALERWPGAFEKYIPELQAWETRFQRSDSEQPTLPDDSGWKALGENDRPVQPGSVWFRQKLTAPGIAESSSAYVALRNVQGKDQVYWNGRKIGGADLAMATKTQDRKYEIPKDSKIPGEATLLVRVFNSQSTPTLAGRVNFGGTLLPLEWEFKVEKEMPLSAEAKASSPTDPGIQPHPRWSSGSYIYNGMLAPLIPYAIRGAIWYQGEANVKRAFQYRTSFPLLIKGWRTQWNQGDFPFYFCQLANFGGKPARPMESEVAELREAQTLTTKLPNTGQAILLDLGEAGNIHPQEKAEVGFRLAKLALNRTYNRLQDDSGPVFKSVHIEGDKIRVAFDATDGGLVAKPLPETYLVDKLKGKTARLVRNSPNSEVEGFAICGEDKKWAWANASIDGDSVIVSSPAVAHPIAVRYGWGDNPTINLYNGAGLPAGPFRTDDFSMGTQNQRFGLPAKTSK